MGLDPGEKIFLGRPTQNLSMKSQRLTLLESQIYISCISENKVVIAPASTMNVSPQIYRNSC
jgi:hypothetical protein